MLIYLFDRLVCPTQSWQPFHHLSLLLPGEEVVQRPGVDGTVPVEGHLVVRQLVEPAEVQLKPIFKSYFFEGADGIFVFFNSALYVGVGQHFNQTSAKPKTSEAKQLINSSSIWKMPLINSFINQCNILLYSKLYWRFVHHFFDTK